MFTFYRDLMFDTFLSSLLFNIVETILAADGSILFLFGSSVLIVLVRGSSFRMLLTILAVESCSVLWLTEKFLLCPGYEKTPSLPLTSIVLAAEESLVFSLPYPITVLPNFW